jgi:hypothetical protein
MLKWLLPVAVAILAGVGLLAAAGQGASTSVKPLTVPGSSTAGTVPLNGPCKGADSPKAGYKHVIWIVMGTRDANDVLSSTSLASNAKAYAAECGSAQQYVSAAHPALPNVPAMVAGTTAGITRNNCPCPMVPLNLFKQVPSWKVYVGGMHGNCSTTPNRDYDPRTNPPTWVGVPAATCRRQDVPMGGMASGALTHDLENDTLPRFSMLVPGFCESMTFSKPCSGGQPRISTFVALGDQWLGQRLGQIVHSNAFTSGSTAVFVTWQAGSGQPFSVDCVAQRHVPSCRVPMIVIAPSVTAGTISALNLSHYSLLKTTESLLGVKHLGEAGKARTRDMQVPFSL